jgi:hypothetical protein
MRGLMRACLLAVTSFVAAAAPAGALVQVGFAPEASVVAAGASFQVEIRADLGEPVLGFGLDLAFDSALLALEGAPEIAAPWLPVFAPDGDGLAAVAFDAGILGDDVLLAVLRFTALAPGSSGLLLSVTPGDLAEGFALDPSGFAAEPAFTAGMVQVVPEPASALLLAAGLVAVAAGRRSSGRL